MGYCEQVAARGSAGTSLVLAMLLRLWCLHNRNAHKISSAPPTPAPTPALIAVVFVLELVVESDAAEDSTVGTVVSVVEETNEGVEAVEVVGTVEVVEVAEMETSEEADEVKVTEVDVVDEDESWLGLIQNMRVRNPSWLRAFASP